jgi:hypothetical protein
MIEPTQTWQGTTSESVSSRMCVWACVWVRVCTGVRVRAYLHAHVCVCAHECECEGLFVRACVIGHQGSRAESGVCRWSVVVCKDIDRTPCEPIYTSTCIQ